MGFLIFFFFSLKKIILRGHHTSIVDVEDKDLKPGIFFI